MADGNCLGTRIRELRSAKGWSQAHLARICGVDSRTIRRIECGANVPSLETFQALAGAFDMEVSDLQALLENGERPKSNVTIIPIPDGRAFFAVLAGSHAGGVDADDTTEEDDAALIRELVGAIECAEIWDEIDPATRYDEERRVSAIIRQLQERHWGVCATRRVATLVLPPPRRA
jgi:putative transcriptional regulator